MDNEERARAPVAEAREAAPGKANASDPPKVEPVKPPWRRLLSTLRSRFARQFALVAVSVGMIAAVGHFIGGMIGWWHAYELTFRHDDEPTAATKPSLGQAESLSIVVLPLTVEGDATDVEWFADALLGDLVSEIATLPGSFVIAPETAKTFKGRDVDPREVARELNVRHIVRGSVRREGSVVRLNLALVDGENGRQRWAEKFRVERAELGQALDEFVVRLGRSLSIEVQRSASDRSAALSPAEVSADDLAMRAYGLWFRGVNRDNLLAGLALLEQAVARSPDVTRAWGGLVFMNLNGLLYGWVPDRAAAIRRIDEAAVHLDRLDPDGFFAYQARVIQSFLKRDTATMLRQTEAWVKLHPSHPVAWGGYGIALVFNGRADEGIPPLERALRLSPRDPYRAEWQYRLATAHFMVEQYEQARDWGQTAQASNPSMPWTPVHAAAMVRLGQAAEARQVLDEFLERNPSFGVERVVQRLPGTDPRFLAGRDRLVASLRELGMK